MLFISLEYHNSESICCLYLNTEIHVGVDGSDPAGYWTERGRIVVQTGARLADAGLRRHRERVLSIVRFTDQIVCLTLFQSNGSNFCVDFTFYIMPA